MPKFSDILNVENKKEERGCSPILQFDYANASTLNHEQVSDIRDAIREISPIVNMIRMESAAIESMNTAGSYQGIIDIVSNGNIDQFHKRLGISEADLFGRSDSGKKDIYISSLTEDVTNFIAQLWEAVKTAIQKVYDWSTNLTSESSKIASCKKQLDAVIQMVSTKGNVSVTCDMCDINDWGIKASQVLRLYAILEELFTTASNSIVSGQLNENMLQDQLVGKMQRNNITDIKLVIADGVKSSSFMFPGIGTSRLEVKDASAALNNCKQTYEAMIGKISSINNAISSYAQSILNAQTQYKCNTDCAAVVSNISSATQLITKSVISINNYVTETLTNCLVDIVSKINSAASKMPDQAPQQPQPEQQQPVQIQPVQEPQQ